ncbi:trna delta -isopentenylpyrophosphate transferase : tRNA dimethylallyltransferase OS=Planctomyces maris DSM 8797 GN=miaA PE=3 SV=1: IPPT [Gemmataceae bacterium]|nr:trna delta -isopentenylpyrophosphate transferase : tRNA dimethylallyltransferase OS=Planctomyces maris DSM 8797 GN=miaA PE=3 SV=1: IPPT [Gemmataceae bacterium]VTT99231.1 trna delta -isopentenylpyrophosphate transferase : tRNA dimethylallyltransferase OS=Planctomyces maris DSM 8797 GN=miaA PE=3 SV=1: IPPT [Gemmataceae bacterium]
MSAFETALILTGPTACGKTALAIEVAERIDAEIVALDSMTVYRGMDIGTAKPTAAEQARVRHHLIDVLDPWESLTVAWWLAAAERACRDITGRGKRPLFVGGTPFYLKALLFGLFDGPPGDPAVRTALEAEAELVGKAALHARLAAVDPKTAARLHPNDVRRVVRALEVHTLTGRPISAWQQTWDTPSFADSPESAPPPARIPAVVLELPREVLYDSINRRVDAMLAAGWLDEVRRLQELPRPLSREARQALGYSQLMAHLNAAGGTSLSESAELIRTHTRQFAKRQLTWFRHLPQLATVAAGTAETLERVLTAFRTGGTVESPPGEIDTPT